jgi:hypothetical protein
MNLQSLSSNIFRYNPNLIHLNFTENQINSVSPNLFKNLTQLKLVNFGGNQCVNKELGCETCSVSQPDLDSALSTCHENCQNDADCKSKSELVTEDDIEELDQTTSSNINSIIQSLQTKLTQELANISENLKSTAEKLVEKSVAFNQELEMIQSKCADDKLALENDEIAKLKQEIKDLKKESQDRENS